MRYDDAALSLWDAQCYKAAPGRNPDIFAFYVFANSRTAPSKAQVITHLVNREKFVDTLNRRIGEAPAHLARPYWIRDSVPIADRFTHAEADCDWAHCRSEIERIYAAGPLDQTTSTWNGHVFYNVTGVPDVDAQSATVVVLQLSHAMIAGKALGALTSALFGEEPHPLVVGGLPPALDRPLKQWQWTPILARVAGQSPTFVARFGARALEDKRKGMSGDRNPVGPRTYPANQFNHVPGSEAAFDYCIVDKPPRGSGITATAYGLAAISRAADRYLAERAEERNGLGASFTILLDNAPDMGVCNQTAGFVDLHVEIPDLVERARAIDREMKAKLAIIRSDEATAVRQRNDDAPWWMARLAAYAGRRSRPIQPAEIVLNHFGVTSVNLGSGQRSLAGSDLVAVTGFPGMAPNLGLMHSVVGLDGHLIIAAAAATNVLPDVAHYADFIKEAAGELAASLA